MKLIGYGPENFFGDNWCLFDFSMAIITVLVMIGL